jgi:hypothetical protein
LFEPKIFKSAEAPSTLLPQPPATTAAQQPRGPTSQPARRPQPGSTFGTVDLWCVRRHPLSLTCGTRLSSPTSHRDRLGHLRRRRVHLGTTS